MPDTLERYSFYLKPTLAQPAYYGRLRLDSKITIILKVSFENL